MKKSFGENTPLYAISDVAKAVGANYSTVWSRIYTLGTLPEPAVRVGRRDFYSAEEYGRILAHYGAQAEM